MEELPRDPAAERASLAALYRYGGDAFVEVDGILTEEVYTDPFHRAFFRCLGWGYEQRGVDVKYDQALIDGAASALGLSHHFQTADNLKLFGGITRFHVERENVKPLADQVRKLHIVRGMRERLQTAVTSYETYTGQESLNEIVARAESAVFDYEQELAGESEDAETYGATAVDLVKFLADNPVSQVGYPTGMPEYDRAIGGGLRPGGIDMIATFAKTGKTFLSDFTAINLARAGVRVLLIDTEMSERDRLPRTVAMLSGVKIDEIETGNYRYPEDREKAERAAEDFKQLPIDYKSVVGKPLPEIMSMMRRWVFKKVGLDPQTRKANKSAVIFDYVKLTSQAQLGKLQEYQAVGFLMTELHAFMVRYGVACRGFVQLNREGDVSQSDRIKWLCTSFSKYRWRDRDDLALEYSKPKGQPRYTHVMDVAVDGMSRYGPGLAPDDFLLIATDYSRAQISEGPLNSKLGEQDPSATEVEQPAAQPREGVQRGSYEF